MSTVAIRLIAILASILLYWLFVEQWEWPVWTVVFLGVVLILCVRSMERENKRK